MASSQPATIRFTALPILVSSSLLAVILVLIALPVLQLQAVTGLAEHGAFLGLGVLGAVFANSTGAGGGVIFIPAFAQLGFNEAQAVATSFGIQCFGMTAGALTWSRFYQRERAPGGHWRAFLPAVVLCSLASALGLWTVFATDLAAPAAVAPMFATFSLFLGISILFTLLLRQSSQFRNSLSLLDLIALPLIGFGGGMVTAWLSVGVGEFVAFYLILRRYDVTLSIAAAVVISAISVWSAAPEQLIFGQQANWQVLALAGPGAVLGGLIARHLVLRLGAHRLKLFFGAWLLIIGLVEFIPFA